jgi:hypothetical protein
MKQAFKIALSNEISPEINTVKISLDGRINSDLDWKIAKEKALKFIERGFSIFWELDLGLFSSLHYSISNQTQFLALGLSLEHFRDHIWTVFSENTVGISIYQGSADFALSFKWDEEQILNLRGWLEERFETVQSLSEELNLEVSDFRVIYPYQLEKTKEGAQILSLFCRDACVDYMALLATRLPETSDCYLLLDFKEVDKDALFQAQLASQDCFNFLKLVTKDSLLPLSEFCWNDVLMTHEISSPAVSLGVCFPPKEMCRPSQFKGLREVLLKLIAQKTAFRIISETNLITEWEGLDELIYVPSGLSSQGKRKLQGFCAAGGTLITLGEKLGLANEITFSL